jgi:hypothetical protein
VVVVLPWVLLLAVICPLNPSRWVFALFGSPYS